VNASGFLNSLVNYEKTTGYDYDFDGFRKFLSHLHDPHQRLSNTVQIAGTKGKGSVAALLQAGLKTCKFRVGLFTSPHLSTVHERIRIDDKNITESELRTYLERIKPYIKKRHRARTYFEVLTAVAFLHFIKKNTDINILETGLGGRLDSTSTTRPIITAITKIGYDHQNLLGTTLPEIAKEKAGIIKSGVPLVLTRQRPSAARILERTAQKKGAPLAYSDTYHSIRIIEIDHRSTKVHVRGRLGDFTVRLPLIGRHHAENLSLTLAILCELRDLGFRLPLRNIIEGIKTVRLRGRFDVVSKDPYIIFDCAHNHESYEALYTTIHDIGIKKFRLIFGTSEEKDFRYCMKNIVPLAQEVILVRADHPRAVRPEYLARQFHSYNKNIIIAGSMTNALEYIRAHSRSRQPAIITGSFYLWQAEW